MKRILASILLILACASLTFAQTQRNPVFEAYIKQYTNAAVSQMRMYRIPASITLAQALLESAAGRSELALKSNNHFGIKRGSNWTGPTVTHYDDHRMEHFRKYDRVEQSYEDHSLFLQRPRYQRLYRLSPLDYKGWAHGLKACGYATSPTYADRLIALIELYELQKLDEDPNAPLNIPQEPELTELNWNHHRMTTNNEVLCIVAQEGDTWAALAEEMHMDVSKLLSLNEAEESIPIHEGDYIYLAKKQNKGPKNMKGRWHKVENDESMFSIAQRYGIRIARLYKMNYKDADYTPVTGDLLKVR